MEFGEQLNKTFMVSPGIIKALYRAATTMILLTNTNHGIKCNYSLL